MSRNLHRAAGLLSLLGTLLLIGTVPAGAGPRRYLVMPFENLSSEPSLNWLGEAISLSVAERFELLGMRTVTRRERIDALEDLSLPSATPLTLATTLRVAEKVRSRHVVVGSFTFDQANGIELSARLLDLPTMKPIWEGRRRGMLAGVFSLAEPLLLAAAADDDERISPAAPDELAAVSDPPLPLYEIIVRSLFEETPEARVAALEKGLEMDSRSEPLRQALAFAQADAGRIDEAIANLDAVAPESTPAGWRLHLFRARLLLAREETDEAIEALHRSIAAGESAEAHLLLASLYIRRGDRLRAETELDLAAGLDPGHPEIPDLRAQVRHSTR